jgi:hypothetical protein
VVMALYAPLRMGRGNKSGRESRRASPRSRLDQRRAPPWRSRSETRSRQDAAGLGPMSSRRSLPVGQYVPDRAPEKGSIAEARCGLALHQVVDSGSAPHMFHWTPPILITGCFYLAASRS